MASVSKAAAEKPDEALVAQVREDIAAYDEHIQKG